jgi:hypothetical protein
MHVGMDKTGTSAIQHLLFNNRTRLMQEYNLLYPETGLWSDYSHHPFAFSSMNLHGYTETTLRKLLKSLTKEIRGRDNVILSSECLFKSPYKEGFDVLNEYLVDQFDDIKIIIYLRRQDEWVESRYKHSIISGSEISIEMLQRPWFCNYKQFLDKWADFYGQENIIVRPYEKSQFTGGSIFSDFLAIFDLDITEHLELPRKSINTSLGAEESEFKKLVNRIGFTQENSSVFRKIWSKVGIAQDKIDVLNVLLLEHANNGAKVSLFSPEERLNLLNRYADINSEIATEYLGRDDGVLFLAPMPDLNDSCNKFSGLGDDDLANMAGFILDRDSTLFNMLCDCVKHGVISDDDDIRDAAHKLLPFSQFKRKQKLF